MNTEREKIYFAKVRENAVIPSKIEENAGYDIYANFEEFYMVINPHETKMIPTGIASACSSDYYFQLFERGSTGTKGIGQRCGVIDSGYRNEWFVPITNHNDYKVIIAKEGITAGMIYGNTVSAPAHIIYPYEKAICQAVLLPVPKTEVIEMSYEHLCEIKSKRGMDKLGSSGK
ncbi:dUTP diphosphatase [Anaerovorax sp. IOR16]|uniref:dUTP diphosphatase n=1 Tax=Anaerovorax sp. IOR16 TaxID=2773458 RepID=UPI0019D1896A|nr:dUTP pyrophosphatase [Anaerovorax sp. IOR16]